MQPCVTVLAPCFNVEKYVGRFLHSILEQEYSPLEIIMVNDGSTDNTLRIIESYREKIESQNNTLRIVEKKNGGLSTAINTGLKYITGDLLIWPDPDDFLLKDSIKIRVNYMNSHPDCNVLRTNGYQYTEQNRILGVLSPHKNNYNVYDFVKFNATWCPGGYMVRMSAFDKVISDRTIYESPAGQDIQILIPLVFYYECVYLDKYLFGYVIHENSMSHSIKTYEQHIRKLGEYRDCVQKTLDTINKDTSNLDALNDQFIRKQRCQKAWEFNKSEDLKTFIREYTELYPDDLELKVFCNLHYNKTTELLLRIYRKFVRMRDDKYDKNK